MKEKYPAFLMNAIDWLTSIDVSAQSPDQRGAYIDALCISWVDNGMDDSKVDKTAIVRGHDIDIFRKVLGDSFRLVDGRWFNDRLEEDRDKLERTKEKKRKAGIASAEARKTREHKPTPVEHTLNTCSTPVEHTLNGVQPKNLKELKRKELKETKDTKSTTSVREPSIYRDIFKTWQEQDALIDHSRSRDSKGFKKELKQRVDSLVAYGLSKDDIITAIMNYSQGVNDGAYLWTLPVFLQRATGAKDYVHGNKRAEFNKNDDDKQDPGPIENEVT